MVDKRILTTVFVPIAALVFRLIVGTVLSWKLRLLVGHQRLTNMLTTVLAIALVIYLFHVWGVIQALMEILLAFSAITAVILFAVKDIWISNLLAGLSLIGDKLVNIGTEIEVGGKKGRIVEMTLTVTKMKTCEGQLIIVPNQKFRQEVIVVSAKR